MPLDDLSETLQDLAIKVHLVQVPLGEEQRVRDCFHSPRPIASPRCGPA
jgi:hypothetical protein